ncbi:hypothetical protein [Mycoplasma sp. OR1901]|uniref:hypothetical protein n=1 Tax=Mycoplasma sp. OR1901 TaxID=2742195 RepID=UPI001581CF34|nr:hypothetical protein [Mycoplasma sp. OR1901]QKT05707.1 hypothetical protein HTZ87_03330 [Mycoplasma sp. OR1901]
MNKFKILLSIMPLPIATIASVACSQSTTENKNDSNTNVEVTNDVNKNTNEFNFEANRKPFMDSIIIKNKEYLKGLADGHSKLFYDRVAKKFYDKPSYGNPDKIVILEQDKSIYTFKGTYDASTKAESSLRANSNGKSKSKDDVIIIKSGNTITLKLWLCHYVREEGSQRGNYIQDAVELSKEFTLD